MTFQDYEESAMFTWAHAHPIESIETKAVVALGLCGESGEYADVVKKLYAHGHQYNDQTRDKLIDELGDIIYYVAIAARTLNIELEEVAVRNNKKLAHRYAHGFSPEASVNRPRIP
jgi:NTP pyrophosphatase (non-canonical NTP hydrolase)